jgi:hypothetical protein
LHLDTEVQGIQFKHPVHLAGRDLDLHVLDGGDEQDLGDAGNIEQDDPTGSKCIAKIYK